MSVELTKDSRKVLKAIYDTYLERRKMGQSKQSAIHFPDSSKLCIDGLEDAKKELLDAGLITCFIHGAFDLNNKGIIYMENFTKDTIQKWLEFGSNFIP